MSLEDLYWSFRKGDYGLLRPQFEILVMALLCSGHLVAYQGARRRGLEDIARSGLKGVTGLGRGEILGEELRRSIAGHPLIRSGSARLPSPWPLSRSLWAEIRSAKERALEDLRALLSRIEWAAAFQAFKNLPWERSRKEIETNHSPVGGGQDQPSLPGRSGTVSSGPAKGIRSWQKSSGPPRKRRGFWPRPSVPSLSISISPIPGSTSRMRANMEPSGRIVMKYCTSTRRHLPPITAEALEELFQKFQRFPGPIHQGIRGGPPPDSRRRAIQTV